MKPLLQSILVADHIYTDAATGKKIITGVFHNLGFVSPKAMEEHVEREGAVPIPKAGFGAGAPFAYISMTDVRGEQEFALRYVDLSDESVLFEFGLRITSTDPLQTNEAVIPLPKLPANTDGVFALELLWNEEPLGSFRIQVKEIKPGQSNDNDD